MHKLLIITGSTRKGRFSIKAAEWAQEALADSEEIQAELLDLNDYDMPFFNEEVTPGAKTEPYTYEAVARFTKKVEEADGYLIVSPEYNHSTSGVLKNALDWVYQEWNNKPVAFISYGNVGGARAVEQLRLIAIELQMAPIRNAVHIAGADFFPAAFGDGSTEELFKKYEEKLTSVIEQLLPWMHALKFMREGMKK